MKHELETTLAACGQEHLLAFWNELDADSHELLAGQIREIDFDLIARVYRHRHDQSGIRELADRASSPPGIRIRRKAEGQPTAAEARERGVQAIAAGELGVILVAGGQGTRLGFAHPKGMFPMGPVSERSLFQIFVEKILAVGQRYGVRVPLYLMTSPATHDETVEFFAENDRFGLAEDDLTIFCQGTMPAVDAATGKVLLAEKDRVAVSPDGHGGTLAALHRHGILDEFAQRGVRHLFYLQVDNPMVDVCDPEFVGYHLLGGSQMSTQVIAKQDPFDRVGNVVEVDGRLYVIEYSDLPDDVARRCDADDSLVIWAGSIAVHVMDVAFLRRMAGDADALPFHVANKKVAFVDSAGESLKPDRPNAIKFERFIFDLIPSASGAIVIEIDATEGFAPLKNASGADSDTPETVRAAMVAQHSRWLHQAGAEVADGPDVEICPLFALDAEELAKKITPGTRVTKRTYFR